MKLTKVSHASLFVRDFHLNMELDESGDVADVQPIVKHKGTHSSGLCNVHPFVKDLSWPCSNVDDVTLDSLHFYFPLDRIVDQDEDDYDIEDL